MTTVTELDIYHACHGTYEDGYPFDLVFQGEMNDETYVGIKRFDNIDVVAFRGSSNLLDWMRNFICIPVYATELGYFVDSGFMIGLHTVWANLNSVIGPHWICTGHSRGAGQAALFAAMMAAANRPPLALVTLAPPRIGERALRNAFTGFPCRIYDNRGDPVPGMPIFFDHPYDFITINVPAPVNDPWGPWRDHHSELYGAAIAALDPMPTYTVVSET